MSDKQKNLLTNKFCNRGLTYFLILPNRFFCEIIDEYSTCQVRTKM